MDWKNIHSFNFNVCSILVKVNLELTPGTLWWLWDWDNVTSSPYYLDS